MPNRHAGFTLGWRVCHSVLAVGRESAGRTGPIHRPSGIGGGVGFVLPAATRILPSLTPLAAIGLAIIMGLAIPFHIMRGEANVIALHVVVVALCVFVA